MSLFTESERKFLFAVARLAYCNPFLTERSEFEHAALGRDYVAGESIWSASVENPDAPSPNVDRLHARLAPLLERIRVQLPEAPHASPEELAAYEDSVHHLLYQRYYADFTTSSRGNYQFYQRFARDWRLYLPDAERFESASQPAHYFACFRQLQRAFQQIFFSIIGNSMPAARLRASVWQSVFTHDMRRYGRVLYARMQDFPTLITGPSGTGKELVARAIAASRYIPFDPVKCRFADPPNDPFIPVNLAALSPTLIESELFGHRRGSFTGAVGDRKGWLDACPPAGSVFLDELGELDTSIQVKLLRVIETRGFSAVGDTTRREFSGKLIAATNRDLQARIRSGHFREDLYYRLCADLIRTPSLREQIDDSPGMLRDLLLFMVRRAVGAEAERSLPEVETWVREHLPANYAWPGNYRELEQCVRNVLIRKTYAPLPGPEQAATEASADLPFFAAFRRGDLSAEEVLAYYAALVYRQTGTYEETAKRLGLDRRTVKAKVETFLSSATKQTIS